MNDADLEYGPTPENSTYEHTDIEPSIATKFALWLAIAMVISGGIVYGTFWLFEGRTKAANEQSRVFPLAVGQQRVPQGPALQTQPFKDVYQFKEAERQKLTSYGWVDQASGVVRIPIDDALRLISERGSVHALPQTPAGLNQVVQDSAAGRTSGVLATDERTRAGAGSGAPAAHTPAKH
jgi:hypothetical protein